MSLLSYNIAKAYAQSASVERLRTAVPSRRQPNENGSCTWSLGVVRASVLIDIFSPVIMDENRYCYWFHFSLLINGVFSALACRHALEISI